MKAEFETYLKSLRATDVVLGRAKKIFDLYGQLIDGFDAREIFASEDLNKEKKREWRSLFFFTDEYILEAKDFVSETNVDITYVIGSVDYMKMQFKDYEPGQPTTSESRFVVKGYLVSELDFEFRASEGNCERLWQICRNILMPNWAEEPEGVENVRKPDTKGSGKK